MRATPRERDRIEAEVTLQVQNAFAGELRADCRSKSGYFFLDQ